MSNESVSNPNLEIINIPLQTIDNSLIKAQKYIYGLTELRTKVINGMKDEEISHCVDGSGCSYYFDVEVTSEGEHYLRITESRETKSDRFDHHIQVFSDDAVLFAKYLRFWLNKIVN